MTPTSLEQAFAPTGVLRASINVGNPVLAHRAADGSPGGVSVDMARALAARLNLNVEFIVFDSARESVDYVSQDQADVGFFALDPRRGETLHFTAPYILIEGAYLVRHDSPLTHNDETDRPGTRIAVGQGSAYDLYLSRTLQHASIVRAPTSPAVVDLFLEQNLDVAAGVRQQLEASAQHRQDLRLLPGRFMVIQQAMGMPRSRPLAAAEFLAQFVEEKKASGFVAQAMRKHGIQGASVAPAAGHPTSPMPAS